MLVMGMLSWRYGTPRQTSVILPLLLQLKIIMNEYLM